MIVLYLINSSKFNYHNEVVKEFTEIVPGEVMEISEGRDSGAQYSDIEDRKPDVIITFDGSGFELRTVMDTLSLNNIYARCAHILFHKPSFYSHILDARQNLSMFTYIPYGPDVESLKKEYPEVPNLAAFPEFYYKATDDNERKINSESIKTWWEEFKRDAML